MIDLVLVDAHGELIVFHKMDDVQLGSVDIAQAKALLANYGASDAALLDVVFGKAKPGGKLPFELPSSMEAVRKQKEDLPHDSENPLFEFGHGLSY